LFSGGNEKSRRITPISCIGGDGTTTLHWFGDSPSTRPPFANPRTLWTGRFPGAIRRASIWARTASAIDPLQGPRHHEPWRLTNHLSQKPDQNRHRLRHVSRHHSPTDGG